MIKNKNETPRLKPVETKKKQASKDEKSYVLM